MANTTVDLTFESVGAGGRTIHVVGGAAAIYTGTMVSQLDADQTLVAGSTAASGPCIGIATHHAAIGAECAVETDVAWSFDNATAGDACSATTPVGSVVYMYDDHTIADNSNSGARFPAGTFLGMDGSKVRIYVSHKRAGDGDAEDLASTAGAGLIGILDTGNYYAATTVEAALAEVVTDLAATTATNGASRIGIQDAAGIIAGTTVETALAELAAIVSPGGVTKIQVVTGTFVSGLCTVTVGAGQAVTAATKAFPCMSAVITGSTDVGGIAHIIASNVVGGSGVGQVLFRVLNSAGGTDVDAAGLFAAILIN
jgi:hypothetical protein